MQQKAADGRDRDQRVAMGAHAGGMPGTESVLPARHNHNNHQADPNGEQPGFPADSDKMSMVDWRWAAQKGYWNRELRRWNEGGYETYMQLRNERQQRRAQQTKRNFRVERPPKLAAEKKKPRQSKGQPRGHLHADASGSSPRPNGGALAQQLAKPMIERPIPYRTSHIKAEEYDGLAFHSEGRLLQFMTRVGWSPHMVRRYWTFGYQGDSIIKLFNSIPPILKAEISHIMSCLDKTGPVGASAHGPSPAGRIAPDERGVSAAEEAAIWEEESGCGFIRVDYDPDTQVLPFRHRLSRVEQGLPGD